MVCAFCVCVGGLSLTCTVCLDKLGKDVFMHLALWFITNMLLQSHEGKFYYKANYLLNNNFSEMQTKLEDDFV